MRRLDRLIGITELAHRAEIEKARASIRADPANATILEVTAGDEPTPAAEVAGAVMNTMPKGLVGGPPHSSHGAEA